jgi:hypothetical protein
MSICELSAMTTALIILQGFVVIFIALHDWLPLPPLNDVKAVRAADSRQRLVVGTILSTLPFAVAFAGSVWVGARPYPAWLHWLLWVTYIAALCGLLRAWWIPYLIANEPARAARYQLMFGSTHAFLPIRNGVRPNTLHVAFHVVVVAILALMIAGAIPTAAMR